MILVATRFATAPRTKPLQYTVVAQRDITMAGFARVIQPTPAENAEIATRQTPSTARRTQWARALLSLENCIREVLMP